MSGNSKFELQIPTILMCAGLTWTVGISYFLEGIEEGNNLRSLVIEFSSSRLTFNPWTPQFFTCDPQPIASMLEVRSVHDRWVFWARASGGGGSWVSSEGTGVRLTLRLVNHASCYVICHLYGAHLWVDCVWVSCGFFVFIHFILNPRTTTLRMLSFNYAWCTPLIQDTT